MIRKKCNMVNRLFFTIIFFVFCTGFVAAIDTQKKISSDSELLFYLPFESSNEPLWACGSTIPLYSSNAPQYVKGLFGMAALYDRVPRPNEQTGWMNYFIGSTYSGIDNLPTEEGTFELWFNPNPAMLEHPYDQKYYFFSVNRSAGMQLYLNKQNADLELIYAEGETNFRWSQGERNFHLHEKKHIVKTDNFFDQWHHIALVYNRTARKVYLDGVEVIHLDALEQSPVTSIDLNVGWGGRLGPYTFYGLLDEFKIWKGCKYTNDFIPEKSPLWPADKPIPNSSTIFEGKLRHSQLQFEDVKVQGEFVEFILSSDKHRYRGRFILNDGMPYLLYCEPGKQLGRERLDADAKHERLLLEQVTREGDKTIKGRATKYNLHWELQFVEKAGKLEFGLVISNEEQWHMLPLQAEITLSPADDQQWSGYFDGTGEKTGEIMNEKAFATQGIGMLFPVNAAWNNEQGIAIAFAPDSFFSWIQQGRKKQNEIVSAWRTVLNPQSTAEWEIKFYSFDPRYQSDDAIARYHDFYPQFFALDQNCDWRIYTGSAYGTEAFYAKKYWNANKLEYFSGQEINRRIGNYWQWFYRSGESTGDWAITKFFNDNSPKFNGLFGALPSIEVHQQSRNRSFKNLEELGIAQNFYFLPWFERRYAKYFTDSLINVFDVDNTQYYYDGWWRGGMRDYVVMPWATRAGDFFKNSIDLITEQYPEVDGFAFDVLEGNHRFRGHSDFNAERAYDQSGIFVDFMLAYAKIAEYIKMKRRDNGMKYTLAGNPHIWRSTYPALFRMDNIIFEGRYFEYINAGPQLRHVSRFMGSKRPSLYQSGRTDYVGNYYPNSMEFSEEQAAAVTAVYHAQTFLRCLLNNLRPTPHLINGFEELQEGILDFKRLMRYEYNFVAGIESQKPIDVARYGYPESGIAVLVNPDLKSRQSEITIDCGYLESVPLLGVAGKNEMSSWRGTDLKISSSLSMEPLSWQLIDLAAALKFSQSGEIAYKSSFSTDGVGKRLICVFKQVPDGAVDLCLRLLPHEKLLQCQLNGHQIDPVLPLHLKPNDQLLLSVGDQRWQSAAEEVLDFPFLHKQTEIFCQTETEIAGQRLVEYFRFWSVNTPAQEKRVLNLRIGDSTEQLDAEPAIFVSTIAPNKKSQEQGIWRHDEKLYIWAPQEKLTQLVDCVLDLLDQKYPNPGRFGYQNTDADFEFARVNTQKTLQKNIAGKRYKIKKILPAFHSIPYPTQ